MSLGEAFGPLRSALERARIRYAIGGSWASTAFGAPRFTNDVDILAELDEKSVTSFMGNLPEAFYVDPEEAKTAIRRGRPFNVIYMPAALKFDFFPSAAFPLGTQELDRAIYLSNTALSSAPAPFVTPEDILLAKLHWFRLGGESSEVQWRDIQGIIRGRGDTLDRTYLKRSATKIGVTDLLDKALADL